MRSFSSALPRLTSRAFERCGPRYAPLVWLAAAFLAIATLTRVALAVRSGADLGLADALRIAAVGFGYDLATFLYAGAPFALWLTVLPERVLATRWHRTLVAAAAWTALFGLLFLAVGEWLFWEEFDSRFNFIAVDYLVYTREVLGNIVQSYPVGWILAAIAAVATASLRPAGRAGRSRACARRGGAARGWTAAVVAHFGRRRHVAQGSRRGQVRRRAVR